MTAFTLAGFTLTPLAPTRKPRYSTSSLRKEHLESLTYSLCWRISSSTVRRCSACSSSVLEKTRISSRYTVAYGRPPKMPFMTVWKVAGALVSPNDSTLNSKCPIGVLNAVLGTSSSDIRI